MAIPQYYMQRSIRTFSMILGKRKGMFKHLSDISAFKSSTALNCYQLFNQNHVPAYKKETSKELSKYTKSTKIYDAGSSKREAVYSTQ